MHRSALAVLGACVTLATPLRGQRFAVVEAGAGAALSVARHTLAGAELGAGYRPGGGQSRVALAIAVGTEDGRAAARGQVTAQFLVTPNARRGAGLYGGVGVAVAGRRGDAGRGYVVLVLGLEAAPGARHGGWYAEVGLAGGARVAAGWRARWTRS